MSFKKYRDIILGGVMLAFSGFYLAVASNIKTRPKLTPSYASAKIVPILLGVLLAVLSVICIIEGILKLKKYGTTIVSKEAKQAHDKEAALDSFAVIATFALMLLYAIGLSRLGFCLSTMLYLFLQISLLAPKAKHSKKSFLIYAIVAVVFTMAIFFIFRFGLSMLLPRGVIEILLGC